MYGQQVDWWTVHQYVEFYLSRVGSWPVAGSVEWDGLEDHDERKMAALLDAARHHALRVDTAQEARADASKAIAGAADWRKIAQERTELAAFRKANPWADRQAS